MALPKQSLQKLLQNLLNQKPNHFPTRRAIHGRVQSSKGPNYNKESLYTKITLFAATSPDSTLTPFLDQWVLNGKKVTDSQLQRVIRTLRHKKQYARALEVSEWMTSKSSGRSLSGDFAVELDLIGKVRGIDAAERYFIEVGNHSEQMYGALLNCYVTECLVDKSLAHLEKMKDLGMGKNPLTYNCIMSLYMHTKQLEKIPEVMLEMEKNGVSPDNVSCRMCLKSYGWKSDYPSMEKLLQRMESLPDIKLDWSVYATAANYHIKGGLHERALHYLQKAEEKIDKYALGFNNLITLYACLGDVDQVMRLWQKKSSCTIHINIDYITMIGSLVKMGELDEAEKIFLEWETNGNLYDFRVPNVLLIAYTQKGLAEKAEQMLEDIICKGRTPIPNSWSIIMAGYIKVDNMQKAVECMKRALELAPQHPGWEPKPEYSCNLLAWLADNADVNEVDAYVELLNRVVPMDREMYHALLRAHLRHGNEIGGLLQRMKDDNIEENEETKKILRQIC